MIEGEKKNQIQFICPTQGNGQANDGDGAIMSLENDVILKKRTDKDAEERDLSMEGTSSLLTALSLDMNDGQRRVR